MTSRTYVPTLIEIAQQMCKYIVIGAPIIRRLYPNNALLLAALDAALLACQELEKELQAVREIGD